MLEARARSARDLRRRLVMKGEPEELVDKAIVRLTELRYLDDGAFALMVARGKAVDAGWSGHRLRQELRRRGVDRDKTDAAIREVEAELGPAQRDILDSLARKRASQLGDLDPEIRKRRLVSFLARRGYPLGDVMAAVQRALTDPAD